MLNKEKFKDEIFEIACNGSAIAVEKNDNKVKPCCEIGCNSCLFKVPDSIIGSCTQAKIKWLNKEYKDHEEVDWSSIAIDTPIFVWDYDSQNSFRRYFAGYKDGKVFVWDNGSTSWSHKFEPVPWRNARLATLEEIKK